MDSGSGSIGGDGFWQSFRVVLGVLLLTAAAGLLGVYYLGALWPGTWTDTVQSYLREGKVPTTPSASQGKDASGAEAAAQLNTASGVEAPPPSEASSQENRGKPKGTGVLLTFVVLVLLGMLCLQRKLQGERTLWGLVLVAMIFVAMASNLLPRYAFWTWALSALPALLVIHHGFYLGLIKPRLISREVLHSFGHQERADLKEMVEANDRYFNTSNIALRYGLPALAIVATGAVAAFVLNPVSEGALNIVLVKNGTPLISDTTLEAARLGVAGAYVYVLLYLGQRGFRHDITSGAALWCAVTLALGPIMAAAISKVWVAGVGTAGESTGWGTQALYLGVGMAPRYVAQAIAQQAQRLGKGATTYVPPARSMPLAMIRGVTPQIDERLQEEGIHDVVGMAMADPLRLQRNTNFDKHQILGWIDSALLAQALPEAWENLEKKGLRGARDLVWYVTGAVEEKVAGFEELAQTDGLSEPLLRNVAQRLMHDAQAQRIQLLYQLVDDVGAREAATRDVHDAIAVMSASMGALPEAQGAKPLSGDAATETPAVLPSTTVPPNS
ncbi:hypothetical protein LXT21_20060 [Myxococcus sp. K38C18041901]|uniref:hypothetical protein n=1 Tax=Myxococcus guangdongensis TaxID=2906760 RepID=UPI0020A77603|nr:hypothetical protein [Myxococcus guangdongensis]MCP3061080.1 hypothetical protein [Myxococcus guangdongensis]